MAHLLVTITGHGFGHIAQTGPVLAALRQRYPDLRLTVVSSAPEAKLRQRLPKGFTLIPRALDFGFVMADPFRIDIPASAAAYREFHADWDARVAATADWLRHLPGGVPAPDLVLSNVAYLPLAAAARAGIPAYAMSSLNWADLFAATFAAPTEAAWAAPIHAQMRAAYRSARAFLQLTPAMPMADLDRRIAVGPVARLGQPRRDELAGLLGLHRGPDTAASAAPARIVLAALGGITLPTGPLRLAEWPRRPGWRWLVPQRWRETMTPAERAARPDIAAFEPLGWDFTDLLASVDAVLGKPGYGTFAEAGCNGTPMLYARRPGWAEQDALIPWLAAHGRCREIAEEQLFTGNVLADLAALWAQPAPPPPAPDGAAQAAAVLAETLADAGGPRGR